jgi:hypothetical protein
MTSIANWYATHLLYSFRPSTRTVELQPGTAGAAVPRWTGNNDTVVYVSNDGLWIRRSPGTQPVRLEYPLFTPQQWPNYYGQVPFAAQFALATR